MSGVFSVVVGIDFSPCARQALAVATQACARAGGTLELIHSFNPGPLAGPRTGLPAASWIDEHKDALAEQLEAWANEARGHGVEVSCAIVEGAASRTLPERARASDARLIVLGRRGSANLAHVLLGSVSERIVRGATCPVLVVPQKSPPTPPERLLVGVDFSAAAKDALAAARQLAAELGASRGLFLAHARPGPDDHYLESWSEIVAQADYPYDRDTLLRWAESPEGSTVAVEAEILEGIAERALPEAARRESCDWIVLGVQGRTALASFLLGSTTDRILKLVDRPVLVVPQTSAAPGETTG